MEYREWKQATCPSHFTLTAERSEPGMSLTVCCCWQPSPLRVQWTGRMFHFLLQTSVVWIKRQRPASGGQVKDIDWWVCPGGHWRTWGGGAWSGWCSAGGWSSLSNLLHLKMRRKKKKKHAIIWEQKMWYWWQRMNQTRISHGIEMLLNYDCYS